MFVIAHAGHWLVNLLYLAPVVFVVVGLWLSGRRARREDGDGDAAEA